MLQFCNVLFYISVKTDLVFVFFVIRSGLCVLFPGHKAHEEDQSERLPTASFRRGFIRADLFFRRGV
jgi:hypothetical protein